MGMSGADAAHLVVAVALTYLLGFERDLRGAVAGDRVFALVGAGAGILGIIAAHAAPNVLAGAITGIGFIGGGLVWRQASGSQQVVEGITTAAALFVLEIRHLRWLSVLDGRRWAKYFPDDEQAEQEDTQRQAPGQGDDTSA
jgi:putative Mg2+ transporter-C (MgtC) family protein